MFSLMVGVCHIVLVGTVQVPACHEEIAYRSLPQSQCQGWAQAGIAQWKMNSKFADDEYWIGHYRCVPDSEAVKRDEL